MPTFITRSTLRPPPFVSVSKGTGYPFPTHPIDTSQHTPAPTSADDETSPITSMFLTSSDNVSLLLGVTEDEYAVEGVSNEGRWWNATDIGIVFNTSSAMTSATTSTKPYFPAGYPSGYTWPHIISASVIVTIVILIIVVGNFLVMWAILRDKNLKGTQNYFIGSLALADFLLGLLIVPFSLANELMGYWHFGTVFCEVWKAVDVLLCTASISSLCLISLDRYWSITKAIHYSRQRTPKRAAVMIFIVWFVSAAVCIPPLIGWNQPAPDSDWPVCALSEDIGYVLYSSMGSFYIPAFIMVFVYFKIYQAAKARARKNVSIAPRGTQGDRSEQKNSTESSGADQPNQRPQEQSQFSLDSPCTQQNTFSDSKLDNQFTLQPVLSSPLDEVEVMQEDTVTSECRCVNEMEDESLTPGQTLEDECSRQLLDFRSRSLSLPCRALKTDELTRLISTDSDSCDPHGGPTLNLMDLSRLAFSMPTTTDTDSSVDLSFPQHQQRWRHPSSRCRAAQQGDCTLKDCSSLSDVHTPVRDETTSQQDKGAVQQFKIVEPKQNGNVDTTTGTDSSATSPVRLTSGLFGSLRRQLFQSNNGKVGEKDKGPAKKKKEQKKVPKAEENKNDYFSAERQKRKLAKARERRATLVLGLVMAAFILCWLPFFLLYVASAFCDRCIPMMVFTVFFWIGYCNSALNPIIYTVFNRDFRRAFHRILFGRKRR